MADIVSAKPGASEAAACAFQVRNLIRGGRSDDEIETATSRFLGWSTAANLSHAEQDDFKNTAIQASNAGNVLTVNGKPVGACAQPHIIESRRKEIIDSAPARATAAVEQVFTPAEMAAMPGVKDAIAGRAILLAQSADTPEKLQGVEDAFTGPDFVAGLRDALKLGPRVGPTVAQLKPWPNIQADAQKLVQGVLDGTTDIDTKESRAALSAEIAKVGADKVASQLVDRVLNNPNNAGGAAKELAPGFTLKLNLNVMANELAKKQ
jgi:hypothetical protein